MLDKKVTVIDTKYRELIPHYEISGNKQTVNIEIDDSRVRRDEIISPRKIVNHNGTTQTRKSVSDIYGKETTCRQNLPAVDKYSKLLLKPLDVERKCQFTGKDRIIYSKESELYRSKSSRSPRKTSTHHWSVLRTTYSGFHFGPSRAQSVITFELYDNSSRGKGVFLHLLNTQRQESTPGTTLPPKSCRKNYYKQNNARNNETQNACVDRFESNYDDKILDNPTNIRKGTLTRVRHTRTGLEIDTGRLKVSYPEPDNKSAILSEKENALPRVHSPSPKYPKKARVEHWVESQRLLHRRCIQTT